MKISKWISAFRLRTLFLSLSCIWAGLLCAEISFQNNYTIALFTFLTALFLQILSNLANDYGDSIHGADHAGRKGPQRAVQSGAISKETMKKALLLFSALAFLSGCALLVASKDIIGTNGAIGLFVVGVLAIAAAIFYTNGKKPYGYMGLGDLSVFIFFGWVAVLGSQYLQTAEITEEAMLLSICYGLLSVGVLNLNNMRDIESDKVAGKHSIPVRLGLKNAKLYHSVLLIIAAACLYNFQLKVGISLPYRLACMALIIWNLLKAQKAKDHASFDPLLKWLSLSTLVITFLCQISL